MAVNGSEWMDIDHTVNDQDLLFIEDPNIGIALDQNNYNYIEDIIIGSDTKNNNNYNQSTNQTYWNTPGSSQEPRESVIVNNEGEKTSPKSIPCSVNGTIVQKSHANGNVTLYNIMLLNVVPSNVLQHINTAEICPKCGHSYKPSTNFMINPDVSSTIPPNEVESVLQAVAKTPFKVSNGSAGIPVSNIENIVQLISVKSDNIPIEQSIPSPTVKEPTIPENQFVSENDTYVKFPTEDSVWKIPMEETPSNELFTSTVNGGVIATNSTNNGVRFEPTSGTSELSDSMSDTSLTVNNKAALDAFVAGNKIIVPKPTETVTEGKTVSTPKNRSIPYPRKCELCDKVCNTKYSYYYHRSTSHRNRNDPKEMGSLREHDYTGETAETTSNTETPAKKVSPRKCHYPRKCEKCQGEYSSRHTFYNHKKYRKCKGMENGGDQ